MSAEATASLPAAEDRSIQPPPRSAILNELFTPAYLARSLFTQPPWFSVPRGRGQRVLVYPGFGGSNASTAVLRGYLQSLGYSVSGWKLGRNGEDVQETLDLLKEDLARLPEGKVTLVGWSLGGYLAREVARECPERVDQVITLGSPVVGGPKYTAIAQVFETGALSIDEIERMVDERYREPLRVPVTALYSKSDGVVAWQACIDEWSPQVEHVQVYTSHSGFGFDASVFRIIAERLARH